MSFKKQNSYSRYVHVAKSYEADLDRRLVYEYDPRRMKLDHKMILYEDLCKMQDLTKDIKQINNFITFLTRLRKGRKFSEHFIRETRDQCSHYGLTGNKITKMILFFKSHEERFMDLPKYIQNRIYKSKDLDKSFNDMQITTRALLNLKMNDSNIHFYKTMNPKILLLSKILKMKRILGQHFDEQMLEAKVPLIMDPEFSKTKALIGIYDRSVCNYLRAISGKSNRNPKGGFYKPPKDFKTFGLTLLYRDIYMDEILKSEDFKEFISQIEKFDLDDEPKEIILGSNLTEEKYFLGYKANGEKPKGEDLLRNIRKCFRKEARPMLRSVLIDNIEEALYIDDRILLKDNILDNDNPIRIIKDYTIENSLLMRILPTGELDVNGQLINIEREGTKFAMTKFGGLIGYEDDKKGSDAIPKKLEELDFFKMKIDQMDLS